MRKLHIMLDLETLGKKILAPVIQIGAVCAVESEVGEWVMSHHTFFFTINFDSAMQGRAPDGSTLAWWLQQSEAARHQLTKGFHGEDDLSPHTDATLEHFTKWVRIVEWDHETAETYLWGNGATSDNAWLLSLYEQHGVTPPVEYWGHRCYRTVKDLFRHVPKPEFVGVKHDAVDDARNQMNHLIAIMNSRRTN